jgi:hypothetical protein
MTIQYKDIDDKMLWKDTKKKKKLYKRKMLYGIETPEELTKDYQEKPLLEDKEV